MISIYLTIAGQRGISHLKPIMELSHEVLQAPIRSALVKKYVTKRVPKSDRESHGPHAM